MPRVARCAALLPLAVTWCYVLQPEYRPWVGAAIVGVGIVGALALGADRERRRLLGVIVPLALGALTLSIYVRTLSPTTDVADSVELQWVASSLRFAHPPGYPLYTVLGHLFTLLPLRDVAWRMNLLSAVAGVLAVLLVYAVGARLTGRRLAGACGALCLAFARDFWSLSLITEVYTLNALLVSAVLYGLVRWTEQEREIAMPRACWAGIAVGALALGAMHHLTIVFAAPVLFGVLASNRPRAIVRPRALLALCAAAAIGLSPILYMAWRWPTVTGGTLAVREVIEYVTARPYAGLLDVAWPLRDPSRLLVLLHELRAQFGVAGWVIAAIGVVRLARRRRQWAVWLSVLAAGYVLFRLGYNAWDGRVILLPVHVAAAILIAAGLAQVATALERAARGRLGHSAMPAIAATAALLLPVTLLWRHAPLVDRSEGWPAMDRAREVLSLDLPPGSIVGVDSQLASALIYPTLIERVRPDVIVALPDTAGGREAIEHPERGGRPVFLLDLTPDADRDYHLRSLGPLIELGLAPLFEPPPMQRRLPDAGVDAVPTLLGYSLAHRTPPGSSADGSVAPGADLGVTLYWRAPPLGMPDLAVSVRLVDAGGSVLGSTCARPVNGHYPTHRWRAGEIVPDYHAMPVDVTAAVAHAYLEVALSDGATADEVGAEIGTADALSADVGTADIGMADVGVAECGTADAGSGDSGTSPRSAAGRDWRRIARIDVLPVERPVGLDVPLRVAFGDRALLVGASAPRAVRPGDAMEVVLWWRPIRIDRDTSPSLTVGVSGAAADRCAPGAAWIAARGGVVATHHRFTVPPRPRGGRLTLGVALEEGGRPLPVHAAHDPRVRRSAFAWRGIVVRDRVDGLDAPRPFADGIRLVTLRRDRIVHPGERTWIVVAWEASRRPTRRYKAFVHLLDAAQARRAGVDRELLHGAAPTDTWRQGDIVSDVFPIDVPPNLDPGGYQLQIGLYEKGGGRRLAVLDGDGRVVGDRVLVGLAVTPANPAPLAVPVDARFGDELALLAYSATPSPVSPGAALSLTLSWRAVRVPRHAYTVFAHLLAQATDTIVAQRDTPPLSGTLSTADWPVGERIDDRMTVDVPLGLTAGRYRLALGLYDPVTGARLPVASAGTPPGADHLLFEIDVR